MFILLCMQVFATLKSASRHRSTCSLVERLFSCSSCGMRFAHEVTLNKHILRAHAGQSVSVRFMDRGAPPQYKCDTCNRRFQRWLGSIFAKYNKLLTFYEDLYVIFIANTTCCLLLHIDLIMYAFCVQQYFSC